MSWRSFPILLILGTVGGFAVPRGAQAQTGWKFTTTIYEVPNPVVEQVTGGELTAIFDRSEEELRQLGVEATTVITWVVGTKFRSEFAGGYAFGDYATGHMAFVSTERGFGIRVTPESAKHWQEMADQMAAAARDQDPLASIRDRMDQSSGEEPDLRALDRTGPGGCAWYELTVGRHITRFCSDRDHPAAELFRNAVHKIREMFPMAARGEQSQATELMSQHGLSTIVQELTNPGFMPASYSLQLIRAEPAAVDASLLQERTDEAIRWLTVDDLLNNQK